MHKLPLKLQPQVSLPTRSIPYYNVLAATLNEYDLTIVHASPLSRRSKFLRPTCIAYPVDKDSRPRAATFLSKLLSRSYPHHNVACQRRIKVLINPYGGQGAARKWFTRDIEPILRNAGCELSVEQTRYKGHAVEIAEHLDVDAFDVVACCSGDGLPYEVFNGLAKKPDAYRALEKIAVVQLPCGTGNAMSINLNGTDSPSAAALAVVKGVRTRIDLMAVTQVVEGKEERYLSFLSQSVGIVADSDLGTENLRWMGDARFTVGFLWRLFGKTVYPAEVSVKVAIEDKRSIRRHFREYYAERVPSEQDEEEAVLQQHNTQQRAEPAPNVEQRRDDHNGRNESISGPLPALDTSISTPMDALTSAGWSPLTPYPTLGNFYAGGMPFMARDANFFQAALPADGCLDLITIDGKIPRSQALRMLLSVSKGSLFDFEEVKYRKVSGYRIVPASPQGYVSIDGESVPCSAFQVEVCRGLGCVLSRKGRFEAPGFD